MIHGAKTLSGNYWNIEDIRSTVGATVESKSRTDACLSKGKQLSFFSLCQKNLK